MGIRLLITAALVVFAFANNETSRFLKGAQELAITCETEQKLAFVLQYNGNNDFDFLKVSSLPPENVHVLVTKKEVSNFKAQLDQHGIKYIVLIDDFQKVIDDESKAQKQAQMAEIFTTRMYQPDQSVLFNFEYYPRYNMMVEYMEHMAFENENITLFNIGYTYEGRNMYGVKISSGGNKTKPAILIDGGIHAREWIAPVTALYAISELAKETNKGLYQNVDWYIIPLVNPDGYEYTQTTDRLWRKTRSKTVDPNCMGVDPNRNFGYKWNPTDRSRFPCQPVYAGNAPFSELETQNLRDFVLSKNGTIKIYVTLHSYGKYLVYPWGYTKSEVPTNKDTLLKLALLAALKLKNVNGTVYQIGSAARLLEPAAGGSDDWAMGGGKADISYTMELPGISFIVDPTLIKPIGLETFEAFKIFGAYAAFAYKNL